MPLPPEGETEADQQMADLKLNFSYVECLMFTFHTLGKEEEHVAVWNNFTANCNM